MKQKTAFIIKCIILSTLLFFSISFTVHSQYLYGILATQQGDHFVRLHYQTGKLDTLLHLGNIILLNGGNACADYNNRNFIGEFAIGGTPGTFHIINIDNLSIQHLNLTEGFLLEFNPYNNSFLYTNEKFMFSVNIATHKADSFQINVPVYGTLAGKTSLFNYYDTSYMFLANLNDTAFLISIIMLNPYNGKLKHKTDSINPLLYDLVMDIDSKIIYGHYGGDVYKFNPYTVQYNKIATIPDCVIGHYVGQMGAYDQTLKKYIIPYPRTIGYNSYPYLAVIDVLKNKIDTIYAQPANTIVYQLCFGPKTLTIPNHQEPANVKVFPNPSNDQVTLTFGMVDRFKDHYVLLYDVYGRLLLKRKITSESIMLNKGNLPASTYYLRVMSDNKLIGSATKLIFY